MENKYGRITILEVLEGKVGHGHVLVRCICDCGKIKIIRLSHLKSGGTKSCGCFFKERVRVINVKHGDTSAGCNRELYNKWSGMKSRCDNLLNDSYKYYGERGITYSSEWAFFENFKKDMQGTYKKGLTIERIDTNKGYSKENCIWTTVKKQNRNKRNNVIFNGECAIDASRRLLGSHGLVGNRIRRGWSKEKAFTTPAYQPIRKKT